MSEQEQAVPQQVKLNAANQLYRKHEGQRRQDEMERDNAYRARGASIQTQTPHAEDVNQSDIAKNAELEAIKKFEDGNNGWLYGMVEDADGNLVRSGHTYRRKEIFDAGLQDRIVDEE